MKLAGFENIKITDTSYPDEKLNTNIPTQQIEAEKLKTEKNYDVRIEVQKTTYKEKVPIENKNKINISKENKYKPKENKTYVKKEVREEVIIKDKKDENKETGKYKNRTYVREQKEEKKENSDNTMEEKRKYIQRRYRFKKNS